jgi:hypothetical protein
MAEWIEFDRAHARYWRDQRGNLDAEIPVRGGDIVERDGRCYAVLLDVEKAVVAVYRLAGAKPRLTQVTATERAEVAEMARQAALSP